MEKTDTERLRADAEGARGVADGNPEILRPPTTSAPRHKS